MGNEFTLEVIKREISKKSDIKKSRNEGHVPGIYYSHDSKDSIPFYITKTTLRDAYKSGARIFNINVGNKKRTVIFKTVQYHPVSDQVLHVDLYGVKMDQAVTVNVELRIIGSAKGILEGGILVQGLGELEIDCLPLDIPEFLEIDVSELNIGDSLRVEDLQLDEKFIIKTNLEQILASVTHPMKEEEPVVSDEESDEDFMDEEGTDEEAGGEASEGSAESKNTDETKE